MPKIPFKVPVLFAAGAGITLTISFLNRLSRRTSFRDSSVVITGGSRGLGIELARLFAGQGSRLTLLARDEDELDRAKKELQGRGADVLVYACDITKAEDLQKAVDYVVLNRKRIDVLINNAGVIKVGPFEDMEMRDFEEALAVHAWAPLMMSRAVLPHMKRQGSGRIVNISSIGGLVAIPHMLPYSMSKFALVGLSDGLRAELSKYGIFVTTVAPGLMRTGSHVNAFFKGQNEKEFAWFSLLEALPLFSTGARRAAKRIMEACRYGEPFVVITLQARALQLANAIFPNVTASLSKLSDRLLPSDPGPDGHASHTGWESRSGLVPSFLTKMADAKINANNENAHEAKERPIAPATSR